MKKYLLLILMILFVFSGRFIIPAGPEEEKKTGLIDLLLDISKRVSYLNSFDDKSDEFRQGKRRLVRRLRKAAGVASNENQKKYLNLLIPVVKREKTILVSIPWGKNTINKYDILFFPAGERKGLLPVVIENDPGRTEAAKKYYSLIKEAADKGLLKKKIKFFPEENIFIASFIKYPADFKKNVIFYPSERTRDVKYPKIFILTDKLEYYFNKEVVPAAKKLLNPKKANLVNFDTFFMNEIFRRLSHFTGPVLMKDKDKELVTVNKKLKELFFTVEEARAGLDSILNTAILINKGYLDENVFERMLFTYLAGIIAKLKPEAGKNIPALIQVNYFLGEGGVTVNLVKNMLIVDREIIKKNIKKLHTLLSDFEKTGKYEECKEFILKYSEKKGPVEVLLNIL